MTDNSRNSAVTNIAGSAWATAGIAAAAFSPGLPASVNDVAIQYDSTPKEIASHVLDIGAQAADGTAELYRLSDEAGDLDHAYPDEPPGEHRDPEPVPDLDAIMAESHDMAAQLPTPDLAPDGAPDGGPDAGPAMGPMA